MATKKRTPQRETPVLRSLEPPATEPATVTADADERIERISLPLTKDGKRINWGRMRSGTKEQMRTLLTGDPDSPIVGAVVTAEAIDPAVVGMLYGSLGMLMVAAARARGFTAEQSSVLIFTDDEKKALTEPTAKVLAKYTGTLGKWQDEIMLIVTLGTVLTAKVSALRKPATVIALVPDAPDAAPDSEGVS